MLKRGRLHPQVLPSSILWQLAAEVEDEGPLPRAHLLMHQAPELVEADL